MSPTWWRRNNKLRLQLAKAWDEQLATQERWRTKRSNLNLEMKRVSDKNVMLKKNVATLSRNESVMLAKIEVFETTEAFRLTSCLPRKERFATEGAANRRAIQFGNRTYECEFCEGWHTSTTPTRDPR